VEPLHPGKEPDARILTAAPYRIAILIRINILARFKSISSPRHDFCSCFSINYRSAVGHVLSALQFVSLVTIEPLMIKGHPDTVAFCRYCPFPIDPGSEIAEKPPLASSLCFPSWVLMGFSLIIQAKVCFLM
jgi:hypothetical protein